MAARVDDAADGNRVHDRRGAPRRGRHALPARRDLLRADRHALRARGALHMDGIARGVGVRGARRRLRPQERDADAEVPLRAVEVHHPERRARFRADLASAGL